MHYQKQTEPGTLALVDRDSVSPLPAFFSAVRLPLFRGGIPEGSEGRMSSLRQAGSNSKAEGGGAGGSGGWTRRRPAENRVAGNLELSGTETPRVPRSEGYPAQPSLHARLSRHNGCVGAS